jgi:histidyl-tRNA synthetase
MAQKPSIPKGTRDFSPTEMVRRNYIFDTIRNVFKKYGFLPIETPAMENLSTLMGKYGEEGDKLLFKILNSGDFTGKLDKSELKDMPANELAQHIAKRGLRYDLTVPFARYVVQHRNEITFPFKRYQIQAVWRADNPQKGRYREFFQCDADMIGSNSLINEFELIKICDEVFHAFMLPVIIKVNNRKVLAGISEIIGEREKIVDITVAIDKLEKIGVEKVMEELSAKGISKNSITLLQPVFDMKGSNKEKLTFLSSYLSASEIGMKGVEELRQVSSYIAADPIGSELEIDITLARGLNYYTGAIIEVKAKDVAIGSICGGGRYDDLTGIFGLPDVSGVGISFGADRIYDVLLQSDNFPETAKEHTQLMFVNFGDKEVNYILPLLGKLRKEGINSELYPDTAKMKKQMTYADGSHIPYVALIGEQEINDSKITLKNMQTGEQQSLSFNEMIVLLKS